MTTVATQYRKMNKGGFPAVGDKVGVIDVEVTLGTALAAANDRVKCFYFEKPTLVLAAGIEVITPTTNAVTASLGKDASVAGSCTEFAGELATNGAAGTILGGGYAVANVMAAAASYMSIEVSADPGADGAVRVWAVVADIDDIDGD